MTAASRFAIIEAVRGLASVLVVWSHTVEKTGFFYTYVFDPGKIGVVVFFLHLRVSGDPKRDVGIGRRVNS